MPLIGFTTVVVFIGQLVYCYSAAKLDALDEECVYPINPPFDMGYVEFSECNAQISFSWTSPLILRSSTKLRISYMPPTVHLSENIPIVVNHTYKYTINRTKPNTKYLILVQLSDSTLLITDRVRCWCTTQGNMPSMPRLVTYYHLDDPLLFNITWIKPDQDGGLPITYYAVYTRKSISNNGITDWTFYANVSDTSFLYRSLDYAPSMLKISGGNALGTGEGIQLEVIPIQLPPTLDNTSQRIYIAVVIVASVLLLLTVLMLICLCKKYEKNGNSKLFCLHNPAIADKDEELQLRCLQETGADDTLNPLYQIQRGPVDEEFSKLHHIKRRDIIITGRLGSGAFGEVKAAQIAQPNSIPFKAAIKVLRIENNNRNNNLTISDEQRGFRQEAILMSRFNHKNIVRFIGVCSETKPLMMILELMGLGDLNTFLRSRASGDISQLELYEIISDVACGCRYLEEQHYVHRDLAARNCLVQKKDTGRIVAKIGDFGLARSVMHNKYYMKNNVCKLPIRWMSPESIMFEKFTVRSDVWSFGILCWEVLNFGEQPYGSKTNEEVLSYVKCSGILDQSKSISDIMYGLMRKCWSFLPNERPTFLELEVATKKMIEHIRSPTYVFPSTSEQSVSQSTNQTTTTDDGSSHPSNRSYLGVSDNSA